MKKTLFHSASRLPGLFLSAVNRLGRTGITPQVDEKRATLLWITNVAALFHGLLTTPWIFIFIPLRAYFLAFIILPLNLGYLAVVLLNRYGYHILSRVLLLSSINAGVFVVSASLGETAGIEQVFLFTFLAPLMLFRLDEWRHLLGSALQPALLLLLLQTPLAGLVPRTLLDAGSLSFIHDAITWTNAVMLAGCIFSFFILHEVREKALLEARDAAEASNRAKSDFLATMSHEIRTPMNAILGVGQLLAESPLNGDQKGCLRLLQSSASLLLTLIDDILDLARIEARKLVLQARAFSPKVVVEECALSLRGQADDKGLALSFGAAEDLPEWFRGDEHRYRQVTFNLLQNAIKFTEKGSVSLRLEAEDDGLVLTVRDTGIGIEASRQSRLFQAFSQVDSSSSRRFGGTGLGLCISKHLARLMGGDIHFESEYGRGSVFRFRAPLAPCDPPQALPVPLLPGALEGPERSVLLVEDNPTNQVILSKMLKKLGYGMTLAQNGVEGVRAFRAGRFHLVLMDCQMPEMDGYAATREIRRLEAEEPGRPRAAIIALTANAMPGDRKLCLDAGMDDYIAKPVEMGLLAEMLRKYSVTA